MRRKAHKACDCCGDIIAEKNVFRYHTVKNFLTIRGDDLPGFGAYNYDSCTDRYELHYCKDCWDDIIDYLRSKHNTVED